MRPRIAVLCVAFAVVPCAAALAQSMSAAPLVTPFSAAKPGTVLPEGWAPIKINDRIGEVVVNEPPCESGIGRIEATSRSLIMGFTDDVVIQIKGDDARSQIDVRSVSRYGMTDFGANAKHIAKLFGEVTAALEKGEKTVLEQAEPKKADAAKTPIVKKRSKKAASKKRSGAD